MTPHPQRCETCVKTECLFNPNAEEDWKSFSPDSTWKFTSLLGCASHSNQQSERDISVLKQAIIEVLDTGFESSERDMALVLDRIGAWERGELRQQAGR